MTDLILIIGALVSSALLTGFIRLYALRSGLVDTPTSRSSHERPTPRGGGLSIVITFIALLVLLYLVTEVPRQSFYALLSGGVLIGGVGFLDDHRHIPGIYRILVHLIAVAIAVFIIGGLPPLQFGAHLIDLGWSGHLLSVVFLVWLTNLFNFMDGIDGIAAMEAIFIAAAAIIISGAESEQYLVLLEAGLAAGCLGFLFWNWPPARIFMGDVGSGFLGFTFGTLAIISANLNELSVWTWLILAGVFVVDATVTVIRRMINGEKWYAAHRSHAYQRATRRLQSHTYVTLMVSAVNVGWLLPLAWFSSLRPEFGWWLMLFAWAPICVTAILLGAGRPDDQ
jgi:Fuc2NAc and GlcNAc transferase